ARFGIVPAAPVTFEQAVDLLGSLGSRRELVVLGVQTSRGLSLAGETLPRLPASVREVWGAAGGGGTRPLRLAVVQRERFAEAAPVSGLVRVDVEIRRPEPSTGDSTEATEDGQTDEAQLPGGGASSESAAPTGAGRAGGEEKG